MSIKTILLPSLHNEEHYKFQSDFVQLVDEFTPFFLGVEKWYIIYKPLWQKEGDALEFIRKSAITSSLEEADQKRDGILKGTARVVKTSTSHFDPTIRESALRLQVVFDHYGNVAMQPYAKETATINNLLKELRTNYMKEIATTSLDGWLNELQVSNDAFDALMTNRFNEADSKTVLRMKELRLEVDEAYRAVVTRINARILLDEDKDYSAFVSKLNLRIDAYNTTIALRKGRKEAAQAKEAAASEENKVN